MRKQAYYYEVEPVEFQQKRNVKDIIVSLIYYKISYNKNSSCIG